MSPDKKSAFPEDLKYTARHIWCRVEADNTLVFGLTEDLVKSLSNVLYMELPRVGDDVLSDVACGELETVSAGIDIYPPLDGEVLAVNTKALDEAQIVLKDPYGAGWLVKVRPTDPDALKGLLSAEQYKERLSRLA
jgi:glycine cleavage system H protein